MFLTKGVRILFEKIPEELKKIKQWVCWTNDKLPKNPHTGGNAMSNNKSTWGSYQQALDACEKYHFNGIGFMFGGSDYFGVDMDHVIENQDLIDEFVNTLQSYTEYSKSKEGIHIICRGTLPEGSRRNGKIEMYSEGRYFIMTGNAFAEYSEIRDCTETIKILHSKYMEVAKPVQAVREFTQLTMADNEIIDKARNCKSGSGFQLLYSGDWHGVYDSQSEADLAFCNILAFWTQKNAKQMDSIFRSSGLMRKKWDERRSGSTYGALTITKACANCIEVYDPAVHKDDFNIVIKANGKQDKVYTKKYPQDDTGNADRFCDTYGGNIRFSYINKCWYFWDGKKWFVDETGEIKKLSDNIVNDIRKEALAIEEEDEQKAFLRHVKYTASNKGKTAMLKESEHKDGVPVLPHEIDGHKEYLNCQSGVINLRNGELLPHNKEMLISQISYSEYQSNCQKPERWLNFLEEITVGDKELEHFLQKAAGYSLSGSTKEQCFFICLGGGQNGKSTFLEVLRDLCGTYAANIQIESLMVKQNSGGANQDIARLKGKRFVTAPEPTEGMRLNESLVKQLTGQDLVTARFLYGKEFEFLPEFKIWIPTNAKPIIRGTDNGIWRRIHLIPFNADIPNHRVDKTLKHKLRKELPQILSWAIEGCRMWKEEGLGTAKCIEESNKEYRCEMDVLSKFVEDCIEQKYGACVFASDLYSVYSRWAEENGEFKMSSTKFGREISKRFNKVKTMSKAKYESITFSEYGNSFLHYNFKFGGVN